MIVNLTPLDYLAISKKHIAVCGGGREIQIYDHYLNPVATIESETKPLGLAYSPNGKYSPLREVVHLLEM